MVSKRRTVALSVTATIFGVLLHIKREQHHSRRICFGPFVEAVENLQKFYFERQIDLFKTSISVPGVARRLLIDTGRRAGASFALFDEANKDLYFTIKNNLVDGPSVIFHRYHEARKTHIRNNLDKSTGTIVGFDANALYLWCIDQEMPNGSVCST